jgi:hypothetical protein
MGLNTRGRFASAAIPANAKLVGLGRIGDEHADGMPSGNEENSVDKTVRLLQYTFTAH